jgi:DNA-binding GntR family transcriptional regulator
MPVQTNELISHKTLADQAFDYLAKAILSGELQTDDRLVESELSKKLGISRAPIREALAELERQGLAYSLVRRGTFVRPWTKEDLWEVAILRATLEALAAQLAIPHVTQDDLIFLEHLLVEMEDAERKGDTERLIDLDFAFHDRVVSACGHARLLQLLSDMRLQIRIYRIVTKPWDYVTYPEMHRDLLEALRKGDSDLARETVYSHVMESAEQALAALPDDGVLSLPPASTET